MLRRTSAYVTAHLAHLERVQSFGIASVDPHCPLLFLNEVTFIFDLEQNMFYSIQFNIQLSCKLKFTHTVVAKVIRTPDRYFFSPPKKV